MSVWLIWLLISIVLFILEIFTPGFFAACLGIAAAIDSIVILIFPEISSILQIIIFSILSIVAFILVRPVALKYLYKNDKGNSTNADGLIGKKGKIVKSITPSEFGSMKIYGDEFTAISEDGTPIEEGTEVEIIKLAGNKVIVKKAN